MSMQWTQAPNIDEVHECFIEIGKVKAQIKLLRIEIEIDSIPLKKENPRKPHMILEGTQEKQRELSRLECRLDELEAQKEFLNFHRDMYKSYAFANR